MQELSLPPSVTVGATLVDISVLTDDGATVQVTLPKPRGLHDLPDAEIVERARRWAKAALLDAADSLAD